MKTISVFLLAMMAFTVGFPRLNAGKNEVVLNRSQVSSAVDIETAIYAATNNGTRPGTVTLDSSQGEFTYTGADRSITISVSNITIRSRNGAEICNCDDGVYFDGPVSGVTIAGITFNCGGSGIVGGSGHEHIVIRDNIFNVEGYVIFLNGASDWQIANNTAEALNTVAGVLIASSSDIELSGNQLNLYQGIRLSETTNSLVRNNVISALGYAIALESASHNRILRNTVLSTQTAGVWLGWNTEHNRVMGNRVKCASGFPCEVVGVDDDWFTTTNKVANNKLIADEPPLNFETVLVEGWNTFILGPSSSGRAYIVDITPLHESLDGAHIPFAVRPVYDGQQWNDVLHAFIPVGQQDQEVSITVYDFNGLVPEMDITALLFPGEMQQPAIDSPATHLLHAMLPDVDPLTASIEGAAFELVQLYTDYQELTLRVHVASELPFEPIETRMRVYRAPNFVELVSEFNYVFTANDLWTGFYLGPASDERGYVVQMVPIMPNPGFRMEEYRMQPEFNGYEWNDVLRVHMENIDTQWQSSTFNIRIFACDPVNCP